MFSSPIDQSDEQNLPGLLLAFVNQQACNRSPNKKGGNLENTRILIDFLIDEVAQRGIFRENTGVDGRKIEMTLTGCPTELKLTE